MHLDDQSVRARCDGGKRQRRDKVGTPAGVARIHDHRQVRRALEHRNGSHVERVARRRLERADAPLAQDDLVVPTRQDVFGGQQQFLDRGGHSTLQQDRPADFTHGRQQREVLHVAGADLEHVRVLGDEFDLPRVHDFGDHRQPGRGAHFREEFKRLEPEPAKRVRRRARLERATAQQGGAGPSHTVGAFEEHRAPLDRTRTGDDRNRFAAKRRAGGIAHGHHSRLRAKLARNLPIRLQDGDDALNPGQGRKRDVCEAALVADASDDGPVLAAREVRGETGAFDRLANGVELRVRDGGSSDEDHCSRGGEVWSVVRRGRNGTEGAEGNSGGAWRARKTARGLPRAVWCFAGQVRLRVQRLDRAARVSAVGKVEIIRARVANHRGTV